jgi:hypothetical protein
VASEATITTGLMIRKGNLNYPPGGGGQVTFRADVTGSKGPTPGSTLIATSGTDVDFTQLTTPGLVRLTNLSADNYVEYGVREPATGAFYPLGEILPGESYVLRFSRNLREEWVGTGTSAPTNYFHLRANTAAVDVDIAAFER